MAAMVGVPDGVAGLVETIERVGLMDAAVEERTSALERAARRLVAGRWVGSQPSRGYQVLPSSVGGNDVRNWPQLGLI